MTFAAKASISLRFKPERPYNKTKPQPQSALTVVLFTGPALAADPIVGTWKLNVAKSRFSPGAELTAGTRVYGEANGLYTLEQNLTAKDVKDRSNRAQYRDG